MADTQIAESGGVFAPWNDSAQKPLIEFQGVTKRFGDFTAIDNISLDIFEREFFALLGPSGCGKTTLMRMLAGFEAPSEGNIYLDGQDIAPVPANQRPVNMMFQSYALFPHLSVEQNIAFGLKRMKMPANDISERVSEMLRLVQLERFASRKPHQISGGQRQRVALARSLARAPKLLLLDEPLGALDKKLREETQFELMDIQERTGTTFVIVTHDQEEAMTVASRIAVMDEGRIIQTATPAEIYEAPNSSYVAGFIGDINLLKGHASSSGGGKYAFSWAEGQPPLTVQSEDASLGSSEMHFAIRPEKIQVSAERPTDRTNIVEGRVVDIGYLGNLSTYHVELAGGQMVKATATNNRRLSRRDFTWEDPVWLSWTETAGLLLRK